MSGERGGGEAEPGVGVGVGMCTGYKGRGMNFFRPPKGRQRIEGPPGTDFNPARTRVPSESTTTKLDLLGLGLDDSDARWAVAKARLAFGAAQLGLQEAELATDRAEGGVRRGSRGGESDLARKGRR